MITPAINIGQLANNSTLQVVSDGSVYSGGERPLVAVFLFSKVTLNSVDYPMGYIQGNLQNPETDTFWNVPINANGLYTYYLKIIYYYSPTASYSTGDWVFDPNTNYLWVSLSNTNVGNGFNSAYWRVYNITDFQTIAVKTSNGLANTFFSANGTSNIVSNSGTVLKINIERTNLSIQGKPNFADVTPNYDPVSAPYGYGGPNPVRTSIPFAMFYILQKSTGQVSLTFTLINPLLDESFNISNINDGCYQLYLFTPVQWNILNAYNAGKIVYDPTSMNFYVAIQNVPTNQSLTLTNYWRIAQYADFVADITTPYFITYCLEKYSMEDYLTSVVYPQLLRKKANYSDLSFKLSLKLFQYYELAKIAFVNKQIYTCQTAIEDFQDNQIPKTNLPALM